MFRLPKSRCGYTEYSCTGIEEAPPLQQPVCDNTNYDQTSDSRPVDNNFKNLPTGFKAVIQSTDFLDLSAVDVWKQGCCVTTYDPFQSSGLTDTFKGVKDNTDFIAQQADFNTCIQCYTDNRIQAPGILLPSAQLSSFYPVPLQAVPTVALAEAKDKGSNIRSSIHSGCNGFEIAATSSQINQVTFSVSRGVVLLSVNNVEQAIQLPVEGLIDEVVQGKEDVEHIQIYVVAGYNVLSRQWSAVLDWKTKNNGFYSTTPKRYVKLAQIGTIHYQNRKIIDVIQGSCSPVDLRDWVSQEPAGSGIYVFSMQNGVKGWLQVRS